MGKSPFYCLILVAFPFEFSFTTITSFQLKRKLIWFQHNNKEELLL